MLHSRRQSARFFVLFSWHTTDVISHHDTTELSWQVTDDESEIECRFLSQVSSRPTNTHNARVHLTNQIMNKPPASQENKKAHKNQEPQVS